MRLSPRMRRFLERLHIIRPRRGRQDVWAAQDRAEMLARSHVKNASLSIKVFRADGRVEDHGIVSEYKKE